MSGAGRAVDSTGARILAAAVEEFAAHGYAGATVRDICKRAGVNIALVNYHFGSKEKLYAAVAEQVFAAGPGQLMGLADTVRDESTWKAAVRKWVANSLEIVTAEKPPLSHVAALVIHADSAPPAVNAELKQRLHEPLRRELDRLVRMALPADLPERERRIESSLWCSGIEARCLAHALGGRKWMGDFRPDCVSPAAWVKAEIDWICRGIFAQLRFRRQVR